jgi:acyl-CoA dehydrogenase
MSGAAAQRPAWANEELELLRASVARFADTEMAPLDAQWRAQHSVGKDIWRRAGEHGFLCTDIPAEHGGGGGDFRHEAVIYEELNRRGLSGFGQGVHSIAAHYLLNHGTAGQRSRLLPRMARGELIGAIAFTEPGAGSDLKGIRTRAERDGDAYVVNGSKIFISNGALAGLIVLAVRTDPAPGSKSLSLLLVETAGLAGFKVGRVLDKMGLHAQDTAELFFEDVRIPAANLLGGQPGQGMYQLMSDLPYERAIIGVCGVAAMEGALAATVDYVKQRRAFGQPVFDFQNSRFRLAELATIVRVARSFIDHCIARVAAGELDTVTASMAKWWITDMQQQVLDGCVQLHGGYGYMNEYLVCRMFADSRVQRIYGGTNEIMKELIARSL